MADTVRVSLTANAWTEISGGATKGFFTNAGGTSVDYAEAASAPSGDIGHPLPSGDSLGVNFDLSAGQKIYARSLTIDGAVSVTTA